MNLTQTTFNLIFFFQILQLNTLNANGRLYFLPSGDNIAQYAIETAIKNSKKEILISANNVSWNIKKLIIKRSDIDVTLLSNCKKLEHNIFEMTLYKHIDIKCKFTKSPTTMLFDRKNLCFIDSTFILCSEDSNIIREYKKNIDKILENSKSYLK